MTLVAHDHGGLEPEEVTLRVVIQVAFPVFQVALGRDDHGELLCGFALERGQRQGPRRAGNQSADRNDARAALDFVEHATKFSAGV